MIYRKSVAKNCVMFCFYMSSLFSQGCAERIIAWLRHTADVMFVLGYCVIAFLKLCFLGILRYEIKEMIQKIKLLQTEMAGAILNGVECDQQQVQQVSSVEIFETYLGQSN